MDIYVKPTKKISICETSEVLLKDVADVSAPKNMQKKIESLTLLKIETDHKKNYLISVIDIITVIDKAFPGHTINNVGEMDTVVEYSPQKSKDNKIIKWTKVFLISMILLTGSATAIMSFHSDAQLPVVFQSLYYLFFNEKIENPMIIDIPYSIGLAVGIIVFFNHFMGKKLTTDPTPIEVEMSLYEADVTDCVIDTLNVNPKKDGDENGSN